MFAFYLLLLFVSICILTFQVLTNPLKLWELIKEVVGLFYVEKED